VALFSGHAPIVVKETPAVTQHFASISIEQVKDVVVPILLQHGAMRAGLFGSLVHGKLGPRSDIDILVELPRNLSLLDVIGIQQELEDGLGRKVDLLQYDAIKPLLREPILRDEVPILQGTAWTLTDRAY